MNRKKLLFTISFLFIFSFGIFFRLSNISPNKIYPDTYQNLLVAENIRDYHSVVGYLGPQGMLYPDFFAWTRPGFPILILLAANLTHDLSSSAQILTVTASILSLIVAFFLGKVLYKSALTGLTAMLLLAFSFNHTVWSGFILTEGLAVFLMLLFLLSFFIRPPIKSIIRITIIRGLLFSLLILTRYEYALIIIPLLIYAKQNYTRLELLYFFISTGIYLFLAAFYLYPIPSTLFLFLSQSQDLLQKSAVLGGAALLGIVLYRLLPNSMKTHIKTYSPYAFLTLLWLGVFFLLVQVLFPSLLPSTRGVTAGLRNFLVDDLVLSCSFLLGVTMMLRRKIHTPLLTFSLLSCILLYAVYFRTNPAMERYLTHLIPFLLIPAAYGLAEIQTKKPFLIFFLLLTFLFQGIMTLSGIHTWGDRAWFSKSYDEHAAELTKQRLPNNDTLLLASFPEPYYFVTRKSTYSISDTYPYVYIPDELMNKPILISEDMGMRDIFPHFTHFLDTSMQDRSFDSFFVNLPYHYANYSHRETNPVTLYQTTVKELKQRIQTTKPI